MAQYPPPARGVAPLCWHAPCRLGPWPMIDAKAAREQGKARARLKRAAASVAQLARVSAKSSHSWRRADAIGRDIGLADANLEQAIRDAAKAGLIDRRADDEGLVILTAKGRAAASQ
jgi:DNA-binding MarR family transcriptional regulator